MMRAIAGREICHARASDYADEPHLKVHARTPAGKRGKKTERLRRRDHSLQIEFGSAPINPTLMPAAFKRFVALSLSTSSVISDRHGTNMRMTHNTCE